MQHIHANHLEYFVAAVLRKLHVRPVAAQIVAQQLIASDRRGLSSHGIRRFPNYVERIVAGAIDPRATLTRQMQRQGIAHFDAHHALGHLTMHRVLPHVIRRTRRHGITLTGISNCEHIGALDTYLRILIAQHLIAIIMVNTPVAVAALAGKSAVIGSNPIGIGIPGPDQPLMLFDGATSATARGRILAAAEQQQPIPSHWALDAQGHPTTDAQQALAGALQPAGSLGYGLGMAIGMLTGVLWAGVHDGTLPSFFTQPYQPVPTSVSIIAMAPEWCGSLDAFYAAGAAFVQHIRTSHPQVRIPGERRTLQTHIAIPQSLVNTLQTLEQRYRIRRSHQITPYLTS